MTITIMDWLLDYTTKVVLAHICIIVLSIYVPVGSWLPLAVAWKWVIDEPFDAWRTAENCVAPVWVFNVRLWRVYCLKIHLFALDLLLTNAGVTCSCVRGQILEQSSLSGVTLGPLEQSAEPISFRPVATSGLLCCTNDSVNLWIWSRMFVVNSITRSPFYK